MASTLYILNFESGLWIHAASEAKIAQQAAKDGWNVTTINCDGFLKGFCSVRASRNRSVEQVLRGIDCKDCLYTNRSTSRINQARGVANIQLGTLLAGDHLNKTKRLLMEARKLVNPLDFQYSGIKLGRIASHETMLRYKQNEPSLPDDGLDDYFLQLEDCLRVFFSFSNMLAKVPKSSKFLIRNIDYSTHRVVALLAEKAGHTVVNMKEPISLNRVYASAKFNRFRINDPARYKYKNSFDASMISFNPTESEAKSLREHLAFMEKSKGFQVYSKKKTGKTRFELLQSLGIPKGNKVYLVALSSTDEVLAISTAHGEFPYPGEVFKDQFELLDTTLEWLRLQKDVTLIVRPHPREVSGARNRIQSKSIEIWDKKFDELPENVILDYPKDGRSLYDLLEIVDTVVTGWSSVGLEAALHEKVAITYDGALPTYSKKVLLSGNSKEEFMDNLDKAKTISRGELKTFRQFALAWILFDIRSCSSVPSRFLTLQYSRGSRTAKKIINFLDLKIKFSRVLDLLFYKPTYNLQGLYDVLLGKKERM